MFAIAPTDNDWFGFLKGTELNSYVNFWTPTPWNVKKLNPSDRWYFLLKSPIREIGGFGEFVQYENLSTDEAWNKFGRRNGCQDKAEFQNRISHYIDKNSIKFKGAPVQAKDYKLGCIILKNCEFWDEEYFKKPSDFKIEFPKQVVKFKYFNNPDTLQKKEELSPPDFIPIVSLREENKRLVNQRAGQGDFKGKILKAYDNRCCITSETCPELLEAAHIQKYINENSNHIQNGLLLRVDLHRLFDSGLLNIDDSYSVQISPELKSTAYTILQDKKIILPRARYNHPSKEALIERKLNFRN